MFAAASTCRRRKSASIQFFANKSLQVRNQNLFYKFFLIILQERHSCALCRPSLVANSGLPDDFSQNMLPKTPTENGKVGWGTRALSESPEIRCLRTQPPAKYCDNKKTSFFDMLILNFKSLKYLYCIKESPVTLSSHYHL